MNIQTIIVAVIVAAILFCVVRSMVKKSKNGGGCSCGCGCSSCSVDSCSSSEEKTAK